jgi:hypothetical protein
MQVTEPEERNGLNLPDRTTRSVIPTPENASDPNPAKIA